MRGTNLLRALMMASWAFLLLPGCGGSSTGSSGGAAEDTASYVEVSADYAMTDTSGAEKDAASSDHPDLSAETGMPYDASANDDTSSGTPGDPNEPNACTPNCDGRQCGPDGCGGSCGWCAGSMSCQDGLCLEVEGCTPACGGKMTGEDDGCGGVCSGSGMGIGLKPGGAQDASYFRKLVDEGDVPAAEFLPIEGWLNEHDTPLPPPEHDKLITMHGFSGVFYDPVLAEPMVTIQLGLNSGISPETIEAASFNLCVVVDKSGSMGEQGKLSYVKTGLVMMVDELDERDYLSIVVYDDTAKVLRASAPVTDKEAIRELIVGIHDGGGTNLYDGMIAGYQQVQTTMDLAPDAHHRVILLTDGMANKGPVTHNEGIIAASAAYNADGVGITTVGVGTNFNYALMYGLANQGQGNFYFIDSASKLVDVFVEEIRYLLTPVAENLKIWLTLPPSFGIDEIFGFEFSQIGDDFVLLGPSPHYDVTPEDQQPNNQPGPDGDVAISTVFASKKNGLLMLRVNAPDMSALTALQGLDFAVVHYSYDMVNDNSHEQHDRVVAVGDYLFSDVDDGFSYFSDDIVRRNFAVLQLAMTMREVCATYHAGDMDLLPTAIIRLEHAIAYAEATQTYLRSMEWSDSYLDEVDKDLETARKLLALVP